MLRLSSRPLGGTQFSPMWYQTRSILLVQEVILKNYVRHIALRSANLQEAEEYYQNLFDMELIGREAVLEDGFWYTLPSDKGWKDALEAGVELGMVALRKGDIVLALFPGLESSGQVFAIGLTMTLEQVKGVKSRLSPGTEIILDHPEQFNFRDRFGISWQIVPPGKDFLMNGDVSGRWLEV
jgi:catechol 2,3-dioxygenase-like lactoylglutathione lyase family enzyme